MLTPSTRRLIVPPAQLITIVAAINASCQGTCSIVSQPGMGLICLMDQCVDPRPPPLGAPQLLLPNITFTLDASGSSTAGLAAPGAPSSASGLWDLVLTPRDISEPLADSSVAAAARSAGWQEELEALPAPLRSALRRMVHATPRQPAAGGGDAARGASGSVLCILLQPPAQDGGVRSASTATWVLGAPFLKAFYSIYDAAAHEVGFAAALQGHMPSPSRYGDGGDAWSGFWGSATMWEFVAGAAVVALAFLGGCRLRRRARRARRARAFEADYRQKLLLGLDPDSAPLSDGASGAAWGGAEESGSGSGGDVAGLGKAFAGATRAQAWALSPAAASQLCDYGVLDSFTEEGENAYGRGDADAYATASPAPGSSASQATDTPARAGMLFSDSHRHMASPLYTPPAMIRMPPGYRAA